MKAQSRSSSTPKKRSDGTAAPWSCARVIAELRRLGEKRNVEGMARFGIVAKNVYGVSKPKLDVLARNIGRNHRLALELWDSGVHDARILAGMIDEREKVTAAQMNRWVREFDNWDICDGSCCHLFAFTTSAWDCAIAWTKRQPEFERKAVNWALRNIGKRNLNLNRAAILAAGRMRKIDSQSARWIAADAIRELKSAAVQSHLRRKKV